MAPGFTIISWAGESNNLWFVRLFFQAKDLGVYEITWNARKGWHKGMPRGSGPNDALGFSVFHQKPDNSIQELCYDGSWHNGKSFDSAMKNTSLAAVNAGDSDGETNRLHLFYCKTNSYIDHWSNISGDWNSEQLSWAPKVNTGLADSSSGKVEELSSWVSKTARWDKSPSISNTLTPGDKPLGAVTDLGPYGRIISVYEYCGDNTITEMCFQERKWSPLFTVANVV
ncbi:hypothetical protein GGX14DRAFT_569579 [Mycena pura]|uniref:Fucose-specific lectin n=1 Tax=Mycena pura TaxID=153505 RepID=A0AAD6YBT7_9AGAR|nr:hypothetical protein GGX14DRAFT_569579 [Mycena pura]